MVICEDLNGTSFGRVPDGINNRTCELFMLDMSLSNPTLHDLKRISVVPQGAEVTGVCPTPDGKTLLVNSQHPSSANPFPYNYSLTYAITGWDQAATSIFAQPDFAPEGFSLWPNPATRQVHFSDRVDLALYNAEGTRLRVYRGVRQMDVQGLARGTYFIRTDSGLTRKLVVQ